jgi:hypothetical protein
MICDIKNSKSLQNREAVQYMLIDMLKEVNIKFAACIACPFIITLGDEWQGLLHNFCDYSKIIGYFESKLGKIDFYCGVGIGDVSIHDFELTVNQLDGPSFYKARNALKLAKENNYSLVVAR